MFTNITDLDLVHCFYADLALWITGMIMAAIVAPWYLLAVLVVLWVGYFWFSVRKMVAFGLM